MFESFENLINDIVTTLYADPIYLVIAVILSGLLVFSLLKRLIKIAIYVLAVAILYIGYLYYTGESVDDVVGGFNCAHWRTSCCSAGCGRRTLMGGFKFVG